MALTRTASHAAAGQRPGGRRGPEEVRIHSILLSWPCQRRRSQARAARRPTRSPPGGRGGWSGREVPGGPTPATSGHHSPEVAAELKTTKEASRRPAASRLVPAAAGGALREVEGEGEESPGQAITPRWQGAHEGASGRPLTARRRPIRAEERRRAQVAEGPLDDGPEEGQAHGVVDEVARVGVEEEGAGERARGPEQARPAAGVERRGQRRQGQAPVRGEEPVLPRGRVHDDVGGQETGGDERPTRRRSGGEPSGRAAAGALGAGDRVRGGTLRQPVPRRPPPRARAGSLSSPRQPESARPSPPGRASLGPSTSAEAAWDPAPRAPDDEHLAWAAGERTDTAILNAGDRPKMQLGSGMGTEAPQKANPRSSPARKTPRAPPRGTRTVDTGGPRAAGPRREPTERGQQQNRENRHRSP